MRTFLATALAVLAIPTVRADEAYTIKLKLDVDTGLTATYRTSSKISGDHRFSDPGNKEFTEKLKTEEETTYKETVLERDAKGNDTVYARAYERATRSEIGKTQSAASYAGRTVLFEKVDGKFRIGVAGESQLDPKDVSRLLKSTNGKADPHAVLRGLAPGAPVKVGDSWSIPVKPVAETFDGFVVDESRSSVVAKLTKVYSKGSATFGAFDVAIKLAYTGKHEVGELLNYDPPGSLEAHINVNLAIDGSTPERTEAGTMAVKGEGSWKLGGKEVRLAADVTFEISEELVSVADDAAARARPKVTFAPDPDEWVVVKPKDGSFTIQFPISPKETNSKTKTNIQTRWLAETHGGARGYGLSLMEFADPAKTNPAALQRAVIASTKGARDIKDIKVNGFAGVEFKVDLEHNGRTIEVIQRTIITKERWFELRVIAPKGNPAEAEKFFKSFEIPVKP